MIAPSTALLAAATRPARNARSFLPLTVVVGVVTLLSIEIAWVAPYVADAGSALADAELGWIALAIVAEFGSMMSFARLQRVMLRSGGVRVRLRDATTTVFAGNAMSVTLPGGSLASLAYTARRMRAWGASPAVATFALTATGLLSTGALLVLAAIGSSLAGDASNVIWAAIEAAALTAAAIAISVVLRRPEAHDWLRGHIGRAAGLLDGLSALHPSRRAWGAGFAFALANWAADLCSLTAVCWAIGFTPSPGTLVLAYALGMAASSSVPFLPGGIGAVETAMVLVLTHGGVPVSAATAAVIVYRCISLGLVAAAGWAVLLVQRAGARTDSAAAEPDAVAVLAELPRPEPARPRLQPVHIASGEPRERLLVPCHY